MMESMSHEVELRSAEPEIIELLIEFIYTARLESALVSVVQLSMTIKIFLIKKILLWSFSK